ncbi:MAG: hypothetical protein JJ866_21615 [Roseibium sp.]|uniref:hypothetical protein n=1 Tax=Roseibium sp. TaxID=1936156 RepID=UPI001B138861|nr:hypothetical protein [Roseibium sp.]MBO6894555.1 hypothetical protein [Roseibium sp.]MBO6929493.1 hypothetical protein [Roseibium sp.]
MSAPKQRPAWQTILISLVMTTALVAIAYNTWKYANMGARQYARGTLLTDLRFFVGLLAVFLVLTFSDRIIQFVRSKLSGD